MKLRLGAKARPILLLLTAAVLVPACGGSGSSGGAPAGSTGPTDITVPTITITAPGTALTFVTTQTPVIMAGTAADDTGVSSVSWSNAFNSVVGAASGTTTWTASVHLTPGPNRVTITALDAAGNSASTSIDVVLRPDSLRAWGDNSYGQVGDGSLSNRATAVTIPGLPGVKDVAVSARHSLALLGDGTVWAWGANESYQLSDNAPIAGSLTPVQVKINGVALDNVIALACGERHSLALRADGTVWSWGTSANGESALGNGDAIFPQPVPQATQPTLISGLSRVTAIASGAYHCMALLDDGTLRVWGRNTDGQLGRGAGVSSSTPQSMVSTGVVAAIAPVVATTYFVPNPPISNVVVRSGSFTGAALTLTTHYTVNLASGSISLTGAGVTFVGATNNLFVTYDSTPFSLGGVSLPVRAIACGTRHSAALRGDDQLYLWGDNNIDKQCSNSQAVDQYAPRSITSGVRQVALGDKHSIVLLDSTTPIFACGNNDSGHFGRGNTTPSSTLTNITTASLIEIRSISAGAAHSTFVKTDGSVLAAGDNDALGASFGSVGDGSLLKRTSPVLLPGLSSVIKVVSSGYRSVAITADSSLLAWGDAAQGQLGDGSTPFNPLAAPALDFASCTTISAGGIMTLARQSTGEVQVVGAGRLGDEITGSIGNATDGSAARAVAVVNTNPPGTGNLGGITQVSAGITHSLALDVSGQVFAWGAGNHGQLGSGPLPPFPNDHLNRPVLLSFPLASSPVVAVDAGGFTSFALFQDGTLQSWGTNDSLALGDSSVLIERNVPGLVPGVVGVRGVSAGFAHTLAVLQNGQVLAWGENTKFQLGNGTNVDNPVPGLVQGLSNATAVSAGGLEINLPYYQTSLTGHSLALLADGTVRAWGNNDNGQLGDGTLVSRAIPAKVKGLENVVAISAGGEHSLALTSSGKVYAWGRNTFGQLGDGSSTNSLLPVEVPLLRGVVAIDAGALHSAALLSDGTLRTWGGNMFAQLGNGYFWYRQEPVAVKNLTNVNLLSAGLGHVLAADGSGTVKAWGTNDDFQIGDGTSIRRYSPTTVSLSNKPQALAAGETHSLVSFLPPGVSNHTILAWGSNSLGESMGSTDGDDVEVPTSSGTFSSVEALAAGLWFSAYLGQTTNVIAGAGLNDYGQLGIGNTTPTLIPANQSAPVRVVSMALGRDHGLALSADGIVYQWGAGVFGGATPTAVTFPGTVTGRPRSIGVGRGTAFAIFSSGEFCAWGDNSSGQLGRGSFALTPTPEEITFPVALGIPGGVKPVKVAGGSLHTVVLLSDGTAIAFGDNANGQLGDGTTTDDWDGVFVRGIRFARDLVVRGDYAIIRQ